MKYAALTVFLSPFRRFLFAARQFGYLYFSEFLGGNLHKGLIKFQNTLQNIQTYTQQQCRGSNMLPIAIDYCSYTTHYKCETLCLIQPQSCPIQHIIQSEIMCYKQ